MVKFVDGHIEHIIHATLSAQYLPTRTGATDVRFIWDTKLFKNERALLLCKRCWAQVPRFEKTCAYSIFGCSVPYSSEHDIVELNVGANDHFFKTAQQAPSSMPMDLTLSQNHCLKECAMYGQSLLLKAISISLSLGCFPVGPPGYFWTFKLLIWTLGMTIGAG